MTFTTSIITRKTTFILSFLLLVSIGVAAQQTQSTEGTAFEPPRFEFSAQGVGFFTQNSKSTAFKTVSLSREGFYSVPAFESIAGWRLTRNPVLNGAPRFIPAQRWRACRPTCSSSRLQPSLEFR